MTRTYLKDLKPEEVVRRLKNGEKVYIKGDGDFYYKMIDGVICEYDGNIVDIGCSILINATNRDLLYFETEDKKPFQITHTGLYKTRDGRKAFIKFIGGMANGVIEGQDGYNAWSLQGWHYDLSCKDDVDIVSEWSDKDEQA